MAIFHRNGRLEEAMATLLQNQAALVQNQSSFLAYSQAIDQRLTELERRIEERFARIETLLLRHQQLLQALPETIRQKIGFQAPEQRWTTAASHVAALLASGVFF